MTLYAITPTILEGEPPVDWGTGRLCERCGAKCSRYQGECSGGGVRALLCSACQAERLRTGQPLNRFVEANRVTRRRGNALSRGQKRGRPLPGLKRILDSRKIASWELSEASGVSRRFVEDLRAGRKRASDECASVLARTLGVGVGELRA